MAVSIQNVTITPNVTTVGQTITIKVSAVDVTWGTIKTEFANWNEVKALTNWNSVKNHINK